MDLTTGSGYKFIIEHDEFGGVQVSGEDGHTSTTLFYLTVEEAVALGLGLIRTATDN
jgi:hypothetical protein